MNKLALDKILAESQKTMEEQLERDAKAKLETPEGKEPWSLRDIFHGDGVITKTVTTKTTGRRQRADKLTWCKQELGDDYTITPI